MNHSHHIKAPASSLVAIIATACGPAMADFIEDSHADLELRNMYMSRNFHQHNAPETMEDWGQGFTLRMKSGFSEGPVGFGLDAMAQWGVKLDSGKGRSETGVLAVDRNGMPVDEWSELGLTAKMRISKSLLSVGTLQPSLPVVIYNDRRLLSGTFSGGMLNSQEIQGLTVNAGHITRSNLRNSSSRDTLTYVYNGAESDRFDFIGGAYEVSRNLTASYYYGELNDIYRQQFLGVVHNLPLAEGMSLHSDLRYFTSDDNGRALGGKIDNDFLNGMATLSMGAHKFALGFQRLSGDGNFPFFTGSDPYSVNLVTFNTFTKAQTDAWQLRYDYDFAAWGIPGLTLMTRYVNGSNIEAGTVTDGREWERNSDITYIVQQGDLKGLSLRWRNLSFRASNGLTHKFDENRLIIGYTLPLW